MQGLSFDVCVCVCVHETVWPSVTMLCMLCCVPEALLWLLQDYYYSDWTAEEREQGKHMQVRCSLHLQVLHPASASHTCSHNGL